MFKMFIHVTWFSDSAKTVAIGGNKTRMWFIIARNNPIPTLHNHSEDLVVFCLTETIFLREAKSCKFAGCSVHNKLPRLSRFC
jgi:hypothetical protein